MKRRAFLRLGLAAMAMEGVTAMAKKASGETKAKEPFENRRPPLRPLSAAFVGFGRPCPSKWSGQKREN
jgi:hypothetical protein